MSSTAEKSRSIERLAHFLSTAEAVGAGDWPALIERASTIMAVLKDPDEEMVAAGNAETWRAMIDAALIGKWGIPARNYPDQGLPWVIASDLLTAEFGDRQAVPVVIDGEAIRGKQSTFHGVAGYDLCELQKLVGARLVFIVENMPFGHKHRIETILDEVEKYPDAKCVFIARGDDALVGESTFATRSAAAHYDSCSISFIEIAHFIQKNFGMSGVGIRL